MLGALCMLLASCGLQPWQQREPWRGQAEEACLARKLVQPTAYTQPVNPINGPGVCGMEHPFRVAAFSQGTIALKSRAVLACPAISTVDQWLDEVVQPAAETYFGMGVAELNVGSYSCRNMNNQRRGRVSEHSYGNAIDLMGVKLTDGRYISVEKGWRGDIAEQDFLRQIFLGACQYFSTVLAPGSDPFHYNHLHMDLARHARGRTICKPVIKWVPQSPPATAPQVAAAPSEADTADLPTRKGLPASRYPAYPAAAPEGQTSNHDGEPADADQQAEEPGQDEALTPAPIPRSPEDRIARQNALASPRPPGSINDLLK